MPSRMQFFLAVTLLTAWARASWGQSVCADSNEYSGHVLNYLIETATATDSASIAGRQASSIPAAAETAIELIRNATICAQAGAAYAVAERDSSLTGGRLAQPGDSVLGRVVHVFRVADRYVVADEGNRAGEFTIAWVFDSSFATLKRLGL